MKSGFILIGVLSAFMPAGIANPQSGSGTLTISGEVQGSINLTFATDPSGLVVTGTATSTASLPLGTVRMYGGVLPSHVTKTIHGVTSFDLSTLFDVLVDVANSASSTYTLSAALTAADATNTWSLGLTNISTGASATLTSTGPYATAVPFALKLNVPASEAATSISNTITFTAVGN